MTAVLVVVKVLVHAVPEHSIIVEQLRHLHVCHMLRKLHVS